MSEEATKTNPVTRQAGRGRERASPFEMSQTLNLGYIYLPYGVNQFSYLWVLWANLFL